ncbi:uncharacterized protein BDV17DRAFT_248565 [Aspergillus undulatus]|uniref:uncharacterized protein n=1 Tax=Aspergillus undulatus TaxID=1810928 RepID=UPI003CCCF3F1
MARKAPWARKRRLETAQAKSHQLYKRRKGIFKKAAEFSLECESDIFVAVRIRKTGQIYIFDSSARANWISTISDLGGCFPNPIRLTVGDIFPDCGGCPPLSQIRDQSEKSTL